MSGNLRREMRELAVHAQNVGVEASVRFATMMGEFASGMGGLARMRGASVRIALVASGVLGGVADALRDQTGGEERQIGQFMISGLFQYDPLELPRLP